MPPRGSNDVSTLRLKYTNETFCKVHAKTLTMSWNEYCGLAERERLEKEEPEQETLDRFPFLNQIIDFEDDYHRILFECSSLMLNEAAEKYAEPYRCPATNNMKQETLEEAAERILANNVDGMSELLDDDLFFFYKGVIQCYGESMAEWQAERSYSEEEVKDLIEDWTKMANGLNLNFPKDHFNKWFEQFKKK